MKKIYIYIIYINIEFFIFLKFFIFFAIKKKLSINIYNSLVNFKEKEVKMNTYKEVKDKIKKFENEYNATVYHLIHNYTEFGELYSFLYVSNNEEEWEDDNADIRDGYTIAYVWNVDEEDFSEFGSIRVKSVFGGLVRTA